jgi:ribosomal protein S18 acetylase RimI-like enzyme
VKNFSFLLFICLVTLSAKSVAALEGIRLGLNDYSLLENMPLGDDTSFTVDTFNIKTSKNVRFACLLRDGEGNLVGGIRFHITTELVGFIELIEVAEEHRHRGFGRDLMRIARNYIDQFAVREIRLLTRPGPAFEWYQRLGYSVFKTEEIFNLMRMIITPDSLAARLAHAN